MSDINIIALGGVRENGKNMYLVEVDEAIYVLDCGLVYPPDELLGIDMMIPDFTYLKENQDRVAGVFLTHGHADAIGALPYLLKDIQVPVFGTELTIDNPYFADTVVFVLADETETSQEAEATETIELDLPIEETEENVIESKIFGDGIPNELFEDALGDFIAIAEDSNKCLISEGSEALFSQHAGYTDDEVFVPLIIVDKTN